MSTLINIIAIILELLVLLFGMLVVLIIYLAPFVLIAFAIWGLLLC